MLRTAWFALVGAAATAFFSMVSIVGGWLGAPASLHDSVHRRWSRLLLSAAGIRVRADGLEHAAPGEARIFVANHQSALDILALLACLPASLRFVAKQELARVPGFAQACRAAGHVFIDRTDRDAALAVMREAGLRMEREGLSLVLFPEGTRSPDGRLQRFRRGTFVFAIEAGQPLVPVAIEGGGAAWPAGRRRIHPGRMRLRLGEAISTAGLTVDDRDLVLERVRADVARMLGEMGTATPTPEARGRNGAESLPG